RVCNVAALRLVETKTLDPNAGSFIFVYLWRIDHRGPHLSPSSYITSATGRRGHRPLPTPCPPGAQGMIDRTRREFLADVGRGMLVAGVGSTLAADLGLASAHAFDGTSRLSFGPLEPLVALMQDTPADKLLPLLVEKLNAGIDLKTLVSAGALANARTFGGQDYVGYHSFMALAPAYQMASEIDGPRKPLPVLKVLYRNTSRMQATGGHKNEVLHLIEAAELPQERTEGD